MQHKGGGSGLAWAGDNNSAVFRAANTFPNLRYFSKSTHILKLLERNLCGAVHKSDSEPSPRRTVRSAAAPHFGETYSLPPAPTCLAWVVPVAVSLPGITKAIKHPSWSTSHIEVFHLFRRILTARAEECFLAIYGNASGVKYLPRLRTGVDFGALGGQSSCLGSQGWIGNHKTAAISRQLPSHPRCS